MVRARAVTAGARVTGAAENGMGGQGGGDEGGGGDDTLFREIMAQFSNGIVHAFAGGVFAGVQGGADFGIAFLLEEAEGDSVAVLFPETAEGIIQHGQDLAPDFGVGFRGEGLHKGLLFAAGAAVFGAQEIGGGEPGGLIEPAGEDGGRAQLAGFFGQDDEDGLGDFLGGVGVAGFAEGGGVDEVDVTGNERDKGRLGIPGDVLREQIHVRDIVHLLINVLWRGNRPTYFWVGI